MKRSLALLLVFPAFSACSVDNEYYMNDYRDNPPPRVQIERPYRSSHGHDENGRYRGLGGGSHVVVPNPPQYSRSNQHGHDSDNHSGAVYVEPNNVHGHR